MSMTTETIIRMKNVSFGFGKEKVLDRISLDIHKGEFLGLIGPNGSGKTTLLKILLGLLKPQEGSIHIFGQEIGVFTDRSKIGYVAQKATQIEFRFPITVEEVVSLGRVASVGLFRHLKEHDMDLIHRALKMVGVLELRDRRIAELSGGQQQRVLIAKALVSEPELLILDEPTVGVDMRAQDTFYQLLSNLNKNGFTTNNKQGLTIIFVSHDIDVIVNEVNKLACLNKTLIYHGTPKDFIKDDYFAKLYGKSRRLILHAH